MVKIGDKVRFLNAVGGGVVSRLDMAQNLAYVEDEDGFEIPVLTNECVVINNIKPNNIPTHPKVEIIAPQTIYMESPATKRSEPIIETPEGETLQVVLAIVPQDIKQLSTTSYNCILINDCNYFGYYHISQLIKSEAKTVANGLIEPNMQEIIAEITKEELNDWASICVQIIPYKQEKNYKPQRTLDVDIQINPVKFYKRHSFTDTIYFEEPAMLFHLVQEEHNNMLRSVTAQEIKEVMSTKKTEKPIKKSASKSVRANIIEVDLHIAELLDSTVGMNNADILQYQMEVVHKTILEHQKQKGQKIVFIHGKGEGVLRKEIEKAMRQRYKQHRYQDASFREYGFGATMVII